MSFNLVSDELLHILFEAKARGHRNLYLNYQHLTELPQELLQLNRAEKVFLKYNILQKLPADIWKLESLVELYLHSNNLQEFPEEIGRLHCLKSLNGSNNYLKSLPSTIGQLTQLEYLHLSNNKLAVLPNSLGNLLSLKVLDVINNELSWLPWQLGSCSKLDTLAFDGNKIKWIPRQLTSLEHLKELSGSRNKLTYIPQDIDQLLSLESLLLDSNTHLCTLPGTLLRLPYLSTLSLHRCGQQGEFHSTELSSCLEVQKVFGCFVAPLLELSLREAHKLFYKHSCPPHHFLLPGNFDDILHTPLGHCYSCGQAVFTGVYMIMVDARRAIQINKRFVQTEPNYIENVKTDFVFCFCSMKCRKIIESIS